MTRVQPASRNVPPYGHWMIYLWLVRITMWRRKCLNHMKRTAPQSHDDAAAWITWCRAAPQSHETALHFMWSKLPCISTCWHTAYTYLYTLWPICNQWAVSLRNVVPRSGKESIRCVCTPPSVWHPDLKGTSGTHSIAWTWPPDASPKTYLFTRKVSDWCQW